MTAALRDRALAIGADPSDTADERFRKRLLVGVALIMLPAGLVWGLLYWIIGERAVALTPWAYVAGSTISLAVFARTRNFAFLRTAQQHPGSARPRGRRSHSPRQRRHARAFALSQCKT
jgi:hypothetical protein